MKLFHLEKKNTDFINVFFSRYDVECSEAIFYFQLKAWFTICCVCWPDLGQKKNTRNRKICWTTIIF